MKAVSPIIATVIIIAFVVVIGAFLSNWFFNMARTTTDEISSNVATSVECSPSSAGIRIDNVFVKAGQNGTVRAVVENTGATDNLSLESAFVYNSTGKAFAGDNIPVKSLRRGQTAIITFSQVSIISCPDAFDRVVVTTNCHGVIGTFDRIPNCVS
jgi:flagellin-like protein